jgi:hypothetical protein
MRLVIAGDEFDGKANSDHTGFTFKSVNIEESGDFELVVDIYDEDRTSGKTVQVLTPTSIGKNLFAGARYVDAKKPVNT